MNNEEIQIIVKEEIELLASKEVPDNDFEIFTKGYLDSLNVLHIILMMENRFNIQVNPYDLHIDLLSSVNKIVLFIESKMND